ncbi:MAG: hypothetical protein AAGI34_14955 [Pseudomonadota bacterium]
MDSVLPPGISSEIETARRNRVRARARHSVVAGTRRHAVLSLSADSLVIEADGRPPLRGFVDILEGERRIDRRLVVCSWAEDGLVGYEFKRDGIGMAVAADYVPPGHAGLLGRD